MSEQLDAIRPAAARPVTGHTDPENEAPWAMQLVAHIEKTDPPTRTAVCQAAAAAVVRLLSDERALPDGEWFPDVQRWTDGRIRKHCRRARGAAWDRVQDLPGVTVEIAGAQVRAFVPTSTADIPRDIGKLQLTGTELEDPGVQPVLEPGPGGAVVVSICPDPFLPLGKAAAAAGHAAQLTAMQMPATRLQSWTDAGFPILVEHPDVPRWELLRPAAQVEIIDAGFTAVAPGTCTALARWA